jgi:hypothetical protein
VFNSGYDDPTLDDSISRQFMIDLHPCILEVQEEPGGAALRSLYIRDADAFLLVYSVASPSSFERVRELVKEIREGGDTTNSETACAPRSKAVPIMLVQNMSDLVADREDWPVPCRVIPDVEAGASAATLWNTAHSRLFVLPYEVLYIVAEHLDVLSALALALSSKRFYDSALWDYVSNGRPTRAGWELANHAGCGFIAVSAKTGDNAEQAFHDVVRMLRQPGAVQEREARKERVEQQRASYNRQYLVRNQCFRGCQVL